MTFVASGLWYWYGQLIFIFVVILAIIYIILFGSPSQSVIRPISLMYMSEAVYQIMYCTGWKCWLYWKARWYIYTSQILFTIDLSNLNCMTVQEYWQRTVEKRECWRLSRTDCTVKIEYCQLLKLERSNGLFSFTNIQFYNQKLRNTLGCFKLWRQAWYGI